MKRGYLQRHEDVSGKTGTGTVAEFIISSDGRVAIFWPVGVGQFPTLEDAIAVHGHGGRTEFVILDDPELDKAHCVDCHVDSIQDYENKVHCDKHDFGCPGCLAGVS